MTLRRAVLLVLGLVVTLSLIPVSLVVQRQVHDALDGRMRDDLERAPRILADRWEAIAAVRMMHARDLSIAAGLSDAVMRGDTAEAGRILTAEAMAFPESPTLIDQEGRTVLGAAQVLPDVPEYRLPVETGRPVRKYARHFRAE